MSRWSKQRWAIFVHDPDGDMGDGRIVGPFESPGKADETADRIRARADRDNAYVECIVVPVLPGSAAARDVVDRVAA